MYIWKNFILLIDQDNLHFHTQKRDYRIHRSKRKDTSCKQNYFDRYFASPDIRKFVEESCRMCGMVVETKPEPNPYGEDCIRVTYSKDDLKRLIVYLKLLS